MWFKVLYLMLMSKKGMSAWRLHRMLGTGSYETVWYMCMRLRGAMKDPDFRQLMGIVEVDETYIGGKEKGTNMPRSANIAERAALAAAKLASLERSAVKATWSVIIENTSAATLEGFVRKTVSDKVELVATDQWVGFKHLNREFPHETVDHMQGEYVRGEVHTANLDSFWALLKRGVIGTYHHVSKKYLPLCLAEFQFRHNNRREADIFGKAVAGC